MKDVAEHKSSKDAWMVIHGQGEKRMTKTACPGADVHVAQSTT